MEKRKKKASPRLALERVIGCGTTGTHGLAVHPTSGDIAYPAGTVVVIYNTRKNKQTKFLSSSSNNPVQCVEFSTTGRYLAIGERGESPSIKIWDLNTDEELTTLLTHPEGATCVTLAPNDVWLASVGADINGELHLWDWSSTTLLATVQLSTQITSLSFSDDSRSILSVGIKQLKVWSIQAGEAGSPTATLEGRDGFLGSHAGSTFYDASFGRGVCGGQSFAVSDSSLLCQLGAQANVERFVDMKTDRVFSLSVGAQLVIGCANGVIRIFDPVTLQYVATLPRPHALGKENSPSKEKGKTKDIYPDAVAVRGMWDSNAVVVVYSDASLYVWDITQPKKPVKLRSFLSHTGAVWDVDVVPSNPTGAATTDTSFPEGTIVTSGADGTLRAWNFEEENLRASASALPNIPRSVYCREMLALVHTDTDLTRFTAKGISAAAEEEAMRGLRCLKISPNGEEISTGGRDGTLRVYTWKSGKLQMSHTVEAHDHEVLSIAYSGRPVDGSLSHQMASSGADGLIHLYDVTRGYKHTATMNDHEGPVTSVAFAMQDQRLLSCGSDKTLKFRSMGASLSSTEHTVASTVYDMDIDVSHKYAIAASHDRKLHVWSVAQAKPVRSYKLGNVGIPYRVQLDPAGIFVATSGDDRYIRLFDFFSGECLCRVPGHGEIVTQLKFMNDCKRLVSTSGDGCIFVWKLSSKLTKLISQRRAELASQLSRPVSAPAAASHAAPALVPQALHGTMPQKDSQSISQQQALSSASPTTEDGAVSRVSSVGGEGPLKLNTTLEVLVAPEITSCASPVSADTKLKWSAKSLLSPTTTSKKNITELPVDASPSRPPEASPSPQPKPEPGVEPGKEFGFRNSLLPPWAKPAVPSLRISKDESQVVPPQTDRPKTAADQGGKDAIPSAPEGGGSQSAREHPTGSKWAQKASQKPVIASVRDSTGSAGNISSHDNPLAGTGHGLSPHVSIDGGNPSDGGVRNSHEGEDSVSELIVPPTITQRKIPQKATPNNKYKPVVEDDDVVCTSDIESDNEEGAAADLDAQEAASLFDVDEKASKEMFRVSLKEELPKARPLAEIEPMALPGALSRVDPVRQSMDALNRATGEVGTAKKTEEVGEKRPSTGLPMAQKRNDPLRRSLTSTFLRRMVEEVDAEVDSKIRRAPEKPEEAAQEERPANTAAAVVKSPLPLSGDSSTAEMKTGPVQGMENLAPKTDSSPNKQLAMSAATGLTTLAEEREALKQRRRLEALNRSAKAIPVGGDGVDTKGEVDKRPSTAGVDFVSVGGGDATAEVAGEQKVILIESQSNVVVEVEGIERAPSPLHLLEKDSDADTSITMTGKTSSIHSDGTAGDEDEEDELDDTEADVSETGGAASPSQEISPGAVPGELEELKVSSLTDKAVERKAPVVARKKDLPGEQSKGVWGAPQVPASPVCVDTKVTQEEPAIGSDVGGGLTHFGSVVRSAIREYKTLEETVEGKAQKEAHRNELLELHRELGEALGLTGGEDSKLATGAPGTSTSGSTMASSLANSTGIPPEQLAGTLDKYSDALMALFEQKLNGRK